MVSTHEVQGEIEAREVDARWENESGVSCVHIAWTRATRRVGNGGDGRSQHMLQT
jgi:hypothetical protein